MMFRPSHSAASRHSERTRGRLDRAILAAFLLLSFIFLNTAVAGENLVVNGDLEQASKAKESPAGWSKPDGITSLWSPKEGNPGKCLLFDTTVLQVDKKKFIEAEKKVAPAPKGRSKGGQYQTVGAHEGVWLYSAPIPVDAKSRYFIIEADVRGPRSSQIFFPRVLVRGYQQVTEKTAGKNQSYFITPHAGGPEYSIVFGKKKRDTKAGDFLQVYRHGLVCRLLDDKKYYHFQMGIKLPTIKRYRPDVILIKPYAMWPLGKYHFDNIVFRPATKAEYDKAKANKHSLKGFSALDEN